MSLPPDEVSRELLDDLEALLKDLDQIASWEPGMGISLIKQLHRRVNDAISALCSKFDLDSTPDKDILIYVAQVLGMAAYKFEESTTKELGEKNNTSVCMDLKEDRKCGPVSLNTFSVTPNKVNMDDLVGLEKAKDGCNGEILMLMNRWLSSQCRHRNGRILLYGPPGTGKTQLAHALAFEHELDLYVISASSILSKYVGETEKIIRRVFKSLRANLNRDAIVFMDEVDSFFRARNDSEDEGTRRLKNEFLTELSDEADTEGKFNYILICATNLPWDLDDAFLRRLNKKIYLTLPTEHERFLLIRKLLSKIRHSLNEDEIKMLARLTERYSPSDISNIVRNCVSHVVGSLCQNPKFRRLSKEESSQHDGFEYEQCSSQDTNGTAMNPLFLKTEKYLLRKVCYLDFKTEIEQNPASTSKQRLAQYTIYSSQKDPR